MLVGVVLPLAKFTVASWRAWAAAIIKKIMAPHAIMKKR